MKGTCIVPGCDNMIDTGHLLPKNVDLRNKWLEAIRCSNLKPAKGSKICTKHFKESDYKQTNQFNEPTRTYILKKNTVPSVFPWTKIKNRKHKKNIKPHETNFYFNHSDESNFSIEECLTLHCESTPTNVESAFDKDNSLITDLQVKENDIQEIEMLEFQPKVEVYEETLMPDGSSAQCSLVNELLMVSDTNAEQDYSQATQETVAIEKDVGPSTIKYKMSVDMYRNNNKALHFYTGLENYEKFMFVFTTLGPAAEKLNYIYQSKPAKIRPIDQFFCTLIILRHNKSYYEVSLLFDVPEKQIANIFITWVKFMSRQWSEISQWPSSDLVNFYAPYDFRRKFPGTRGILDGTEIPILRPGRPNAQQSTFSTYKNKSTVKTVVFASPGGLVSHLSTTYSGSTSDRQITERSDLMKKCDPGDSWMADKGFDIQDLLAPYGIKLNIPTFMVKKKSIFK